MTTELLLLVLLCIVQNCDARFNFTLKVLSHSTDGSCDTIFNPKCETFFSIFCLRGSYTERSTDSENCPLGSNGQNLHSKSGTRTISSQQPWQVIISVCVHLYLAINS